MHADALITSCTDHEGASPSVWEVPFADMKPGAPGFIHIHTEVGDKTALALRAAGFDRRDTIMFFGGQCASLVLFVRKPLSESSALAQVLATGTGAINIKVCRIDGHVPSPTRTRQYRRFDNKYNDLDSKGNGPVLNLPPEREGGRWPPNMLFQHLPSCRSTILSDRGRQVRKSQCDPKCFVEALEYQSRERGVQGTRLKDGHAQDGAAARFFPQFFSASDLLSWLRKLAAHEGGVIIDPFAKVSIPSQG